MFEKFTYVNHLKEKIKFGTGNVFAGLSNLHDYSWGVSQKNNKISAFAKKIITKTIPVYILCESESEGIEFKNRLFEIFEKDVLAEQYGKIIYGDYYLKCYISASTKSNYLIKKRYLELKITLTTDMPFWIKESKYEYGKRVETERTEGNNLDYSFDYNFDYTSNASNDIIENESFVASDFRMIIYGPCINPSVNVAGHEYSVNTPVSEGDMIIIDSSAKTVTMELESGKTENCFNKRNKKSYIFKKIPEGMSNVFWNKDFDFDIILLEERGEPKWI